MLTHLISSLPLKFLSRFAGLLTTRKSRWFNYFLIKSFIIFFKINLQQVSRKNLHQYKNFNDFFTRELSSEIMSQLSANDQFCSPAEGILSEWGLIAQNQLIQAKGIYYDLGSLLGESTGFQETFEATSFMTIYLAPKNYHRVHMPMAGQLIKMAYIPGQLFPVNSWATQHIPQLFCQNERLICQFLTEKGSLIIILVGAFLVGSISTSWLGDVNPAHSLNLKIWDYQRDPIFLKQYQELGLFKYGSTVIVLFSNQTVQWKPDLKKPTNLNLGDPLATLKMHSEVCYYN